MIWPHFNTVAPVTTQVTLEVIWSAEGGTWAGEVVSEMAMVVRPIRSVPDHWEDIWSTLTCQSEQDTVVPCWETATFE